ncbi:unnamed protein product [Ixodes hexagonus]
MCDRFGALLKLVSQALSQDDRNEYQASTAYVKYVESLEAVAASLLSDYQTNGKCMPESPVPVNNTKKVIAIARQCLDRLDKILGTSLNMFYAEQERLNETYCCPAPSTDVVDPFDCTQLGEAGLPPVTFVAPRLLARPSSDQSSMRLSSETSATMALLPNPMFAVDSVPEARTLPLSVCPVVCCRNARATTLLPMEQAQQENSAICKRYQRLIQRTRDPVVKENLRLELQRRLVDNLTMARAKQAEHLKRLKEQEKTTADMAWRKLQGAGECATPEDRKRQELFVRILQYEDKHEWPPDLQSLVASRPKGLKAARHLVMHILGDAKHPLNQWLVQERMRLQTKMAQVVDTQRLRRGEAAAGAKDCSKAAEEEDTAALCAELVSVVRTAMLLLGLAFESLRTDEMWDVCYGVLEDHLTWPLWPQLLDILRRNFEAEQRVAEVMGRLSQKTPKEMHVPSLFWQHHQNVLEETIHMLRTVPRLSPSQKIRVLVYVARLVCMDPASSEGMQDKPLGADDLVPTLSYVLVQSAVPQLYSECLALEQVLDSRYMLGEEGYCLTSILMALKYLESLT